MQPTNRTNTHTQLRIIKTARSQKAINEAAEQGFRPLVKPVIPSPEIRSKYAVLQDRKTGKIEVVSDYRMAGAYDNMKNVIDFTFYYPYRFESPFAAYLVPPDLQVGELVVLEDLIEDVISGEWNQGDIFRLKSCQAIWNGNEFILQHDPNLRTMVVG
ncbi:hypothetical protein [Mucilaginibacter terrae]|uniref:Uncharacterized protein n=1 Tax=Mucilaginibacter terrae TaxID=1955052 RepID=A0ABU3GVE1_9SPHI|nr:hypothetical protein [Mucilaginibacter terrae]MDT3403733.1 hypothetical protein [Mucilaginibacter terrae]